MYYILIKKVGVFKEKMSFGKIKSIFNDFSIRKRIIIGYILTLCIMSVPGTAVLVFINFFINTNDSSQIISIVNMILLTASAFCIISGILILMFVVNQIKNLSTSFERNVSSVIQMMISSADELGQTATKMTQIVENVSDGAQSVMNVSGEISGSMNSVAAAAEEMSSTSTEITGQISNSVSAVKGTVETVSTADEISRKLDEVASTIGRMVEFIQSIAEQTNLLALNAAIESARAGDAGRGFAVVSDEVKKLAVQTAKATQEISEQISNVQSISGQVVSALGKITESVSSVESYSDNISSAISEQSIAISDVTESISSVSVNTNKISSNISNVASSTMEAQQFSLELECASSILVDESNQLNERVNEFLKGLQ
jgi:methyl-accepting chemotaxis protein